MAARLTKDFVQVFGQQYQKDAAWTNVTPKILSYIGRLIYDKRDNPLYLLSERIRHFFIDQNHGHTKYQEFRFESPVVTLRDNFDSLLIPKDHVSRAKSDTYYVNANNLLRCHTSAHQMHCLQKGSKAFICIADCFRRDEIDSKHFPVFHQCELFYLYNHREVFSSTSREALSPLNIDISALYDKTLRETKTKQAVYSNEANEFAVQKLKATIEAFTRDLFDDPSLQMRWVNAYFPFTHPSFELEILWMGKWMELLGCGIVRSEILDAANIDGHIGFAAGFGLERFAMLKYQITDIRLFWSNDSGFLHQFENKSPFEKIAFKQFSNCPQCINDLSFWLPSSSKNETSFNSNDLYDLVRSVGDELVEQVKLVDEFRHPKTNRTSHCYRIVYRSANKVLTKEEVNEVHGKIADACKSQFNVELR